MSLNFKNVNTQNIVGRQSMVMCVKRQTKEAFFCYGFVAALSNTFINQFKTEAHL